MDDQSENDQSRSGSLAAELLAGAPPCVLVQ